MTKIPNFAKLTYSSSGDSVYFNPYMAVIFVDKDTKAVSLAISGITECLEVKETIESVMEEIERSMKERV